MADDRMKNLLMIREPSPSYPRARGANRPTLAVTMAHHHGNSEFIRGSIAEPGGDPARSEMAHRRWGRHRRYGPARMVAGYYDSCQSSWIVEARTMHKHDAIVIGTGQSGPALARRLGAAGVAVG